MASTIQQLRAGRVRTMGLALTVGALVLGTGGTTALAQSASPAAAGDVYTVSAVTTDLGTFLTGEGGKTLYYFLNDTAPGATTCSGGCADNWPAFKLEGTESVAAGTGVTGVLASFPLADGAAQVTYDGRPLYYFVGDAAAGDANGQGINSVWYVAAADGSVPAMAPAASPAGDVYTVSAVTTDLGTFLTGEGGKTLYYFLNDTAPGATTCSGGCADNWPAFKLEGTESVAAGTGVTGVLASFPLADGAAQVTYDGRPLYYFVGDAAAGDANGQGINSVWYVAAADGSVPAMAP